VRAEVAVADIATGEGRAGLIAELRDRGRDVEVLVNNAGFGSAGRFQDLDGDKEALMVRTNCESIVALCAEYVPPMVGRGRGGVLNVASTASFQPLPYQATYSASKAFVRAFTEARTGDLHGTGVTATALCPGPVRTEFTEVADLQAAEASLPGIFWSSAEDVARAGISGMEKGKRVVIPGALNRAGALGGQHAPRSVILRLAARAHPARGS
jgi:short-subunit dehydrogenase